MKELESDNTAQLHFVNGPVEAIPPDGFEDYFGAAPYYRFIEPAVNDSGGGGGDVLDRIRNFPKGATAEDQMRELMRGGNDSSPISEHSASEEGVSKRSARAALAHLYHIMEEDGPFEGIMGYSEGATVAATLLLHEQHRFENLGIEPMFKCALFFAGWPPLDPELETIVLADESELSITIPTCHISKCNHINQFPFRLFPLRTYSRLVGSIFGWLYCTLQHLRYGHRIPLRSR